MYLQDHWCDVIRQSLWLRGQRRDVHQGVVLRALDREHCVALVNKLYRHCLMLFDCRKKLKCLLVNTRQPLAQNGRDVNLQMVYLSPLIPPRLTLQRRHSPRSVFSVTIGRIQKFYKYSLYFNFLYFKHVHKTQNRLVQMNQSLYTYICTYIPTFFVKTNLSYIDSPRLRKMCKNLLFVTTLKTSHYFAIFFLTSSTK